MNITCFLTCLLQILNLIFLRFVFQDKTSANWQEKMTKMVNAEQPVDLKYTLYAGELFHICFSGSSCPYLLCFG